MNGCHIPPQDSEQFRGVANVDMNIDKTGGSMFHVLEAEIGKEIVGNVRGM
jgi:hypothetical protein